jgi:hypothetical protein
MLNLQVIVIRKMAMCVVAFVLSICSYAAFTRSGSVSISDVVLSDVPVNCEHGFYVTVVNTTAPSARVLGMSPRCFESCCVRIDTEEEILVEAYGSAHVPAKVAVNQVGEFGGPLDMFVDHAGLRTIRFNLKGNARNP